MFVNFVYGVPGIWSTCVSERLSVSVLKKAAKEMWEALRGRNCLVLVYFSLEPHDYHVLLTALENVN